MDIFSKLEKIAGRENNSKSDLAKFLLEYKGDYSQLKIREIVDTLYASTAVCTRLAKELGYTGFSELKYQLEAYKQKSEDVAAIKNTDTENFIFEMNDTFSKTVRAIDYDKIILGSYLITHSKKIILIAEDYSSMYIDFFKLQLEYLGFDIRICSNKLQIDRQLSLLTPLDVVIIFKYDMELIFYKKYITTIAKKNAHNVIISQQLLTTTSRSILIEMPYITTSREKKLIVNKMQINALLDMLILEIKKEMLIKNI